ncbi:MAG: ClpX C4-type zinc finger protein [Candidatus Pristimantibacillus sp.]
MVDGFRKKMFRGAKIEDLIISFDELSKQCEEYIKNSETMERQRFYEGMAIAYQTVSLKLKGAFDYLEPNLLDELYKQVETRDMKQELMNHEKSSSISSNRICSFCKKDESEVKHLVAGPNVAICDSCLDFGKQVMEEGTKSDKPE